MKKLYILLLAGAAAISANAAELTFFLGNQEITPGSTVKFADYEAEEYEAGVWDITMNPPLTLKSSFFTNKVSVTATCTSGQSIQMCCGGQCSSGTSVTKEKLTINTGASLPLELEYINHEFEGSKVPDITVKISASDNGGTPVEFTIEMGPSAASLSTVSDGTFIHFNGSAVEYNTLCPTPLAIYSLTGVCVASTTVEGAGTVSTTSLAPGVYFCKAGNETGKILVK